jgi:tRNA uridine 5-carbamoylmethylation protein Kti12
MELINLYGGPCAGKSTAAARIFSFFKGQHLKTELVGEFAKELIYQGNEIQLVNQVYIMGSQYRKQKDLQRFGIDIAVSDSPLGLQLVYCQNKPYYNEISALVNKLNEEFENTDIFIRRACPYQTYGRAHTEKESDILSQKIWDSKQGKFDFVIDGNMAGIQELEDWLNKRVAKKRGPG